MILPTISEVHKVNYNWMSKVTYLAKWLVQKKKNIGTILSTNQIQS